MAEEDKKTQAQLIKELQAQLEEKDSKLSEYETEITKRRSVMEPSGGPGRYCEAWKYLGGETLADGKGKPRLIDGEKVSICRSKYTVPYRMKGKKRVGASKPSLVELHFCEHHANVVLGKNSDNYRIAKSGKTEAGVEKETEK